MDNTLKQDTKQNTILDNGNVTRRTLSQDLSHCAMEGTSFGCDGGGSGGGHFGALTPGFFSGFLMLTVGAKGFGSGLVSAAAVTGVGGAGAGTLGGAGAFILEYWTVICSLALVVL